MTGIGLFHASGNLSTRVRAGLNGLALPGACFVAAGNWWCLLGRAMTLLLVLVVGFGAKVSFILSNRDVGTHSTMPKNLVSFRVTCLFQFT